MVRLLMVNWSWPGWLLDTVTLSSSYKKRINKNLRRCGCLGAIFICNLITISSLQSRLHLPTSDMLVCRHCCHQTVQFDTGTHWQVNVKSLPCKGLHPALWDLSIACSKCLSAGIKHHPYIPLWGIGALFTNAKLPANIVPLIIINTWL